MSKVQEHETVTPASARVCLARVFDWYQGMVSPTTGRLVYVYDPRRDEVVLDGEPIRDIASVADVARLSTFLGRRELGPMVERSLAYWESLLTERGGGLVFDAALLGAPPGIAHSAFLILAMLEAEVTRREEDVRRLAEGILGQQRADGSLKIYFGGRPDDGLEFYPGEALLALLRVHAALGDTRCLDAAERGFACYRARYAETFVPPHLLVFYTNWQSQYGARLHQATRSDEVRAGVAEFLFALHDRIVAGGFYDAVASEPERQACVEVACGLEGLVEAQVLAARAGDRARADRYGDAARIACTFLFRAQRLRHCTPRERGGFGQSLADRLQRIDVTGHAANGIEKAVAAGVVT